MATYLKNNQIAQLIGRGDHLAELILVVSQAPPAGTSGFLLVRCRDEMLNNKALGSDHQFSHIDVLLRSCTGTSW